MIVLDTNVVSEALRLGRDQNVVSWLDSQTGESLFLTATSLSELMLGIESLPLGRRKKELSQSLSELLQSLFGSRILPFDKSAAVIYGTILASARSSGKSISVADGQIGAICKLHGFSIATRDTSPFLALGVPTINPWSKGAV